jgi:LysR family transcriptional regulator for metE and metH
MKLEIRHLQLVQAIAQEGSVTEAGNRLHLTQPALSRQLRDAERRLGVALFLRLKKGMVLTPAGEELLDSARKILEQLQSAEERAGNARAGAVGLLRLSTECLTCYHWLPSRLSLFRRKWPGIEVRIVVEATPCPAQFLLEGKIDVAIVSSKVNNRKLIRTPLFRDELVAILSPRHPLATRPFVTARDFSDQHLFVYNMPLERNRVFREILLPAGVTPQRVTQMQLTEAILELVKAGLGVGVLARWAAARELDSKSVVGVPITPRGMHRQWSAMSMKTEFVPSYRSDFISLLARLPFSSKD